MSTPMSITLNLDQAANRRLLLARANDGIPSSVRIRAALTLWTEDADLRSQIDRLAVQLRHARLAATKSEEIQVKLTIAVGPVLRHELQAARLADSVPASERIRAALQLWDSDAELRGRINGMAQELKATA